MAAFFSLILFIIWPVACTFYLEKLRSEDPRSWHKPSCPPHTPSVCQRHGADCGCVLSFPERSAALICQWNVLSERSQVSNTRHWLCPKSGLSITYLNCVLYWSYYMPFRTYCLVKSNAVSKEYQHTRLILLRVRHLIPWLHDASDAKYI